MWTDLEALRRFHWWLSWLSIAALFLGGVGLAGARLFIERRISSLTAAREQEREKERLDKEAQLRKQLEESRHRVVELEERQKPRTIDTARAEEVVRALKVSTSRKISIGTVTDREAAALAEQVIHIFQKAGWTIVSSGVYPTVFTSGLIIVVKDKSRPPPGAQEIRTAFLLIGVEINVETLKGFGSDEYPVLIIGSKH